MDIFENIAKGNLDAVKDFILKGGDLTMINEYEDNCYQSAIYYGRFTMLKYMLHYQPLTKIQIAEFDLENKALFYLHALFSQQDNPIQYMVDRL